MSSNEYIDKILNNIKDGKYSCKELENLYKNAVNKNVLSIQYAVQDALNNFGNTKVVSTIPIKLAIVGNQSFTCYENFCFHLQKINLNYDTIVSGGAKGTDSLAERFAQENNLKFIVHLPDWKRYGKAAGPVRNELIIQDADFVLAFWNMKSLGTKSAINLAKKYKKPLKIIDISKEI